MSSAIFYMNTTLVCLCLSFIAQLCGMIIPSVLHYVINYDIVNYNINKTHIVSKTESYASRNFAIWYVITCGGSSCQISSYHHIHDATHDFSTYYDFRGYDFSNTDSEYPFMRQVEFQVEVSLALVVLGVTVILVVRNRKKYLQYISRETQEQPELWRHATSVLCALISGSLVWIPVGTFIQVNSNVQELVKEATINKEGFFKGYYPNSVGTPYAVIISGTGGVLAILSCLFIFLVICKSSKCRKHSNCDDNNINLARPMNSVQHLPLINVRTTVTVTTNRSRPNSSLISVPTEEGGNTVNTTQQRRTSIPSAPTEEPTEDLSYNTHNEDGRPVEEPPPSYEECMQNLNKPH